MNKVTYIAGGAAVCLTAASVGGYYMLNSLEDEGNEPREEADPQRITAEQKESLMFEDLSAFKSNVNADNEGIKGFFDGISNIADSGTDLRDQATFNTFIQGLDDTGSEAKSYVRIEHQKKPSSDDTQWYGKFMWLWTFVSKDKGFITFNVMETTGEQKLTFKGVFYLLEKEASGWKVSYKQEAQEKEIGSQLWNSAGNGKPFKLYFPNPKHDIKSLDIPENWGFMEWDKEDEAFKKMCANSSCGSLKAGTVLSWTLEWKQGASSGTATPSEWTDENRWGPYLYGDGFDWKTPFKDKNLKGKWTRKGGGKTAILPSA